MPKSMENLFRKEVLAKREERLSGKVIVALPISTWVLTAFMCVILSLAILAIVFGEYRQTERVRGILEPDQGIVRVISGKRGSVEDVFVSTGQKVFKGDLLLTVNLDETLSDGSSASFENIVQLEGQLSHLKSDMSVLDNEFRTKLSSLAKQIESISREQAQVEEQIQIQERSVAIEKKLLDQMRSLLEDEAASRLEVATQEAKYLNTSQGLLLLHKAKHKLAVDQQNLNQEIKMVPFEKRQRKASIRNAIFDLELRLQSSKAGKSYTVVAELDGVVSNVQIKPGQYVDGSKAMMTLIPDDAKLIGTLYIPSGSAGRVKQGQTVQIRYSGFSDRKFGTFEGVIVEISKSVLFSSDLQIPRQEADLVFVAYLELTDQQISQDGVSYDLLAGMEFDADIFLGKKHIWEWIVGPLMRRKQSSAVNAG